ncbi:hypothetical protein KSP24_14675 [Paenibacillus sp. AK121]|uniref:hypothetical protein n=1 Tax=Paenibacillus sp. AK121 TaxID=2849670 RepID=UPI001C2237B1|nr:hypothetical protein [Paenibacillus sp. AK121]MBU9708161.1 hypothetical protein [Paenibacillus sp. AK121]
MQFSFAYFRFYIVTLIALFILTSCNSKNAVTTVHTNSNVDNTTHNTAVVDKESQPVPHVTESSAHTVTSDKDLVALTIPAGWRKFKQGQLDSVLSVCDKEKKNVGLVFRVPKSAFANNMTLDEFVQQREEISSLGLENFKAVDTNPIQIDSTTARTADYSGNFKGQQVYYFSAMFESKQHYLQVLIYSRGGSAIEKHHEFATIASSLKILSDSQVEPDLRSTTILKTFKSEDAQQRIRLPYVWKSGLILNPDALIQAWYEKNDAYMAVIKDWKSELPYEKSSMITLKEYAEFSAQLVLKRSGKGIILTGPIKVNINGNQGLQYEVWTESDKVKVVYLITYLEHTDSFSQIILWTRADYYDDQKSEFQRYTKTYREEEI